MELYNGAIHRGGHTEKDYVRRNVNDLSIELGIVQENQEPAETK